MTPLSFLLSLLVSLCVKSDVIELSFSIELLILRLLPMISSVYCLEVFLPSSFSLYNDEDYRHQREGVKGSVGHHVQLVSDNFIFG
jgi:hypothetical protein